MRKLNMVLAAALAVGMVSAPAIAADAAAAPAANPLYSTTDTDIGTLLDNPATKAVLDKILPGFSTNEQVAMARGMTLRAIQQFAADQITDERLTAIDAELAKLTK